MDSGLPGKNMSRTHHHGDKKKTDLYGDHWHWMRGAPKWFSKMTRHRPQRAHRTRAMRNIILLDPDEVELVEMPGDKKPQEYYW